MHIDEQLTCQSIHTAARFQMAVYTCNLMDENTLDDTVASTRTVYVQVGVKRHSQHESLAIIAKNNF